MIKYNVKDSKEIVDVIYCLKYNCYFSLQKNNSIAVLNRDFDEVYRVQNSSTVLCMLYNPLNDELLTSSLSGIKVWKLEQQMIPDRNHSTKPLGNHRLVLQWVDDLASVKNYWDGFSKKRTVENKIQLKNTF